MGGGDGYPEEERTGSGIPKVAGTGRNRKKGTNFKVASQEPLGKVGGPEVKGTGSGKFRPPASPPAPPPPPPTGVRLVHMYEPSFEVKRESTRNLI